jgi:hypothetical protein
MKKVLAALLKTLLVLLAVIVLGVVVLAGRWLFRRADPTEFLPAAYTAYLQVPSLRSLYDRWLYLAAADVVLARPDFAPYRGALADLRGLSLTRSPIVRELLDVRADVVLLPQGGVLAVVDLGWRGILTPLARFVGPLMSLQGFSFLNDAGQPLYRYTTGGTTITAALYDNVAVVSLDPRTVKEALQRKASDSGMAAVLSRDLLRKIRLRSKDTLRVLVDGRGLSSDLLSPDPLGKKILGALQVPGQTMMDVKLSDESLAMSASLPISASLPELAAALAKPRAPLGVLRYVPASVSLLTVLNVAPLSDLYKLAAAFQGKDVQDLFTKADEGARSMVGAGIEELLFSWVGSEMGTFVLSGSTDPVYFARVADERAWQHALERLTHSAVAGRDSSLVLDGVRIDRLSLPWYVGLILDIMGASVPEPYFINRGGYLFLSLDAENLAAVARTADTGDNLAGGRVYAALTQGQPADMSLLFWYDAARSEPYLLKGSGMLFDVLHLYAQGVITVRATPSDLAVSLTAARAATGGAAALPGFPVSPEGGVSGDVLAFRFADAGAPVLAWIRGHSVLVLADAAGRQIAEAQLETDSALVPEESGDGGALSALWAVSPGGTVWRFGANLQVLPPFPVATGISSPMPPRVVQGRLALFSRPDSTLVMIGPDGSRSPLSRRLDAPLLSPPDVRDGRMAFYPKSFDARIFLTDLAGVDAPGWPVQVSGISLAAPRIVADGQLTRVCFLTQAGRLYLWDSSGSLLPPFPLSLPGVFSAAPAVMKVAGTSVLITLAQDGSLSMIGLDGSVRLQVTVPELDGRRAQILCADLNGDGRQEILLYGADSFITGYDDSLRPLPGFPVKGYSRPQVLDLNKDGGRELVTAGIDGKIYAYAVSGRKR